jgi:hypothetical protein
MRAEEEPTRCNEAWGEVEWSGTMREEVEREREREVT